MEDNNKRRTYSRRAFLEDGFKLSILGALYSPLQSAAQIVPFGFWKKQAAGGGGGPVGTPGKLFSWGTGSLGRLGTTNNTTRSSPAAVGSLATWVVVAANSQTGMAIKSDGTLWAWGQNASYQFGNGNTTNRSSPVQVGTDTNWVTVATGGDDISGTSFGIKSDGTLWGWGSNRYCVLNPNSTDINGRSTPTQFGTDTNWKSIAISATSTGGPIDTHVHATKTDGTLWSWGDCLYLGADTNSPRKLAFVGWSQLGHGSMISMGVRTDGTLWGWGKNWLGQLNDGGTTEKKYPVQIGSDTNWRSASVSVYHVMALKTDNTLWTWGANMYCDLGDSAGAEMRSSPVQVGGSTWNQVVAASTDIWLGEMTSYSMGVRTDGTLWAWGDNTYGQLGITVAPVQVGSDTSWTEICVGKQHVLGIKSDGTLWAWGGNNNGQLGIGSTTTYYSPKQVGTATDWAKLPKSTHDHSLAIKSNGTLWAWGLNDDGQLGTNNTSYYSSPVQVGADTNWANVYVGEEWSFGIKVDGSLWAWGKNDLGVLGTSNTTYYSSPVQVGAGSSWAMVSAGNTFTAGVTTGGNLHTWGSNTTGQLGNGNTTPRSSPAQVGALTNWSAVACGPSSVIASKTNGQLWAWGYNDQGQLGTSNTTNRSSPVQVGALTDWSAEVAAGWSIVNTQPASYAIKSDGTLWSWGYNTSGQLGDSLGEKRSSPVQIGSSTWTKVSSRGATGFAIRNDGTLWSWGNPMYGKVGAERGSHASSQVGVATNWASISTSNAHSLGIRTDGTLWAWGYNGSGQLGLNDVVSRFTPVQVGAGTTWSKVSAGRTHTAAIKTDGTLWTWGANGYGQLGHNNVTTRSSPVQVGTDTNWSAVMCSYTPSGDITLAIKTNGTLWGWGDNTDGQLGDGTTVWKSSPVQIGTATNWSKFPDIATTALASSGAIDSSGAVSLWGYSPAWYAFGSAPPAFMAPVQVGTDTNWKEISVGCTHVMAVKTTGSLWGWGSNSSGCIGIGTTDYQSSAVQVGALTDWSTVSAGNDFTMAIKSNGTLWSWGTGTTGCLGDGTAVAKSSPVQIGALTNWKQVSAGKEHFTLAVKTDGTLWSWGQSAAGRLGQGPPITRSSPVQVGALTTWVAVTASQTSGHGTQT